MRRESDYQGSTNWETWNVGVWMDNEVETQEHSQALVTNSKDDNEAAALLKEWAIQTYIGPHNRDAIEDARDWNSIPEEERIDHNLEDMKKHNPEDEDLFNKLFGQGDVRDVDPTIIDPEMVNWLELVQGIKNSLAENHEWEFNLQKGRELGIDFMHQHGSDPDLPKNRMYDAWMRHHNALSDDEIKAQGGKTWDHPQAENKLMMWNPIEAIKAGGSEYGWPHGFGDKHAQEIEQNGGWNEHVSEVGRKAVIDALYGRDNPYHPKLREAMQARGYAPEVIEQMMQPQFSWDAANETWLPLNQQPKQADPTLDQPGDMTIPEDWHTASSDDWNTMFDQAQEGEADPYYEERRPFLVGFESPEDPSPEVWIGNPGQYHHDVGISHPVNMKDKRFFGEIWENTNPPVFRNADGPNDVFDDYAIPLAERQYYQQQGMKKRAMGEPEIMYHMAPVTARESILQQGLQPDVADPMHPGIEYPRGVYLYPTLDAYDYSNLVDIHDVPMDVWAVNLEGLDQGVEEDPFQLDAEDYREQEMTDEDVAQMQAQMPMSYFVRCVVPPDHLTLLGTENPGGGFEPTPVWHEWREQGRLSKTSSDGADYWTQGQDDWWGTQNSSLFNIEVPGEAPGMPRNMETGFTKPCWCDVGPTDPHEWSGACENGKHPILGMVSTPDQIKMPTDPPDDGWGDAQYDTDTFLDHRMINQHLKTQEQAEQYREYIERQKRQRENAWPSMGVKEAADNVPGAPVSDSGHWAWLDGKVGFGGTHSDIAESLADELGYSNEEKAYISNWLARGHCPEDKAVAVGTLKNNKPFIWNSTRDRNHVFDSVMRALSDQLTHGQ